MAREAVKSRKRRRIVVLEDNREAYETIREFLEQEGYRTTWVETGTDLRSQLERAQSGRSYFELVMIDVDLSDSGEPHTGYQVYQDVFPDFPHENYVIYTRQDVERFRSDINRLMYRDVHLVLLDEVLDQRNLRLHLSRVIQRGGGESVFMVYGRNTEKKEMLARFLSDGLGMNIIDWDDAQDVVGDRQYIYDIVLQGIEMSDVTVVLFTDDEDVRLRQEFRIDGDPDDAADGSAAPRRQSRANVYIEAGYAMGRRPGRTIFVVWPDDAESFDFPSDFEGLHVVQFTGDKRSRAKLKRRLEAARCSIRRHPEWETLSLS